MIKLIASDVDGTIIPYKCQKISDEFFAEAERLIDSGVAFCFASGRQYANLKRLAGPIAEKAYYICENGAVIVSGKDGRVLSRSEMDREQAIRLADRIHNDPEYEVFISGGSCIYLCTEKEEVVELAEHGLCIDFAFLSRPEEMPEPIVKVSAYCRDSAAEYPKLLAEWGDVFNVAIAGENWVDFTVADKGTGLASLCALLRIRPEETAAFGDNFNDIPMLELTGHPYIMQSAAEELLQRFPHHCGNVAEELRKISGNADFTNG